MSREKRSKQLEEKLGIDTNEIVDVPIEAANNINFNNNISNNQNEIVSKKKSNLVTSNNNANQDAQHHQPNVSSKKDETPIEKITREELRKMKGFQKLLKKQHKEKDALKKKHNKEKQLMQKNHSAAIDKLTTIYNKKQNLNVNNNDCVNNQPSSARSSRSSKRSNQENNNNNNNNNDKDKIGELVEEQTRMWVALVERQTNEEKQLNNDHIDQQCNIFEQLLGEAQKQRIKFIEQKQTK